MKKLFLFGIMFLIMLGGALALNTVGLVAYWSFNESSGTNLSDSANNGHFGTALNGVYIVNGILDYGRYVNSSISPVSLINVSNFSGITNIAKNDTTINVWLKLNRTGIVSVPYDIFDSGSGNNLIRLSYEPTALSLNIIRFEVYDSLDGTPDRNVYCQYNPLSNGSWQMITARRNQTNNSISINGIACNSSTYATVQNLSNNTGGGTVLVTFGNYRDTGYILNASIDELSFWNKTLNDSDVNILYNAGAGFNPLTAVATTPVFVNGTPANGAHNNTPVTFSVDCGIDKTTLYLQNVSTPLTKVLDNSSSGVYTVPGSGFGDGLYYYVAFCYEDGVGSSANTSLRNWTYDTVNPVLTVNGDNFFDVNNFSVGSQYNQTVFLNLSFSDVGGLYAYEINISKGNVTAFYELNQSLSGSAANLTRTINVSNWSNGRYNVALLLADSHTARRIGEYRYRVIGNVVDFDTLEGNHVELEVQGGGSVDVVRNDDRYVWDVNFSGVARGDRFIHVRSDSFLRYVSDSGFGGHFVVWNDSSKLGNWLDFENSEGVLPDVVRVDDYHYIIGFQNMRRNIRFRSIGGLNVLQVNYSWYRGNYTQIDPNAFIDAPTMLSLNVTRDSTIDNISADLFYNGAFRSESYNVTYDSNWVYFNITFNTSVLNSTYPFWWRVNVSQIAPGADYTFNTSASSQSVQNFSMFNCSVGGGNLSINLTYRDENTPSSGLTASDQVDILYWYLLKEQGHNFSNTLYEKTVHYICISPDTAQLRADLLAVYNVSGGFTHRFYLINQSVNASLQSFELYNVASMTGFSDLRITLRSATNYQFYPNIVGKLQRFYVGEGVWRTVQMDKSGEFGLLQYDIIETTVDYRLVFVDEHGVVLKTTESAKFGCVSGLCDITILLSNVSVGVSDTTTTVLSFDNNTNLVSLYWSDPEGDNVNVALEVLGSVNSVVYNVCNSINTGSSGTLTCSVAGVSGLVQARYYVGGSLVGSEWFDVGIAKIGDILSFKEAALWSVAIYVTTVGFGLFSPVAVIVCGFIGLMIIYLLGLFSPISFTFLVVSAVIGVILSVKLRN